ncbi:MAG TPA: diguanylate cyclase [Candidatus Limnocylindrales bacterium]|nr:diguanylate cyclase [Candidatus Limnocylindrales bacterium]
MAASIRARLILTLLLVVGGGALVQVGAFVVQRNDAEAIETYSERMQVLAGIAHELEEVIAEQQTPSWATSSRPGHRDQVTVSIGIATWPTDARERVKLLEVADAALYRAKSEGRNRVVVASEALVARSGEIDAGATSPGMPPFALARAG